MSFCFKGNFLKNGMQEVHPLDHLDAHFINHSCLVISGAVIYDPFGARLPYFNYQKLMLIERQQI